MTPRPLSELQRRVLAAALRWRATNRAACEEHGGDPNGVDVYCSQLLGDCYGLGAPRYGRRRRAADGDALPSRAQRVALSRALTRLEARGLVTVLAAVRSDWTGIALTADGEREAANTSLTRGSYQPLPGQGDAAANTSATGQTYQPRAAGEVAP